MRPKFKKKQQNILQLDQSNAIATGKTQIKKQKMDAKKTVRNDAEQLIFDLKVPK